MTKIYQNKLTKIKSHDIIYLYEGIETFKEGIKMIKNLVYLSFICLFVGICSYSFFYNEQGVANRVGQVEKIVENETPKNIIGYISGPYEHIYKKRK